MNLISSRTAFRFTLAIALCLGLTGCIGAVVGTVVDVGIEVAKVPFKVGKAVVDVVSDDDDKKSDKKTTDGK